MKTPQGLHKISKSEKINFFISLFENSPIPKSISSVTTKKYLFVNPAWEIFTGFSKEMAIGNSAFELNMISLESGALLREKLLIEKEIISYEGSIQLKSGIKKKVLMSFDTIIVNNESFILNTLNNLDDLHLYKRQQEKHLIKRTQELLNAQDFIIESIEIMADGFVSLNKEWVYTYVNKKASKMLGRKPKELIGKHIWTEFPEGVDLPFYKKYHKAAETQQPQYIQEYYPPFDAWFENRIYPSPDGLTIFFTDITQRKKAEMALQESENHIKTILETEPECIKQLNAKGELIYMNPAGLAMIEADNLEMVKGNSVINLISPNYRRAFKKLTIDVFKGNSGHLVFELNGLKGTNRWLETHAVPLKDSAGKIISLLGITRDITKRKHADELLIQKEQELNAIYSSLVQPIFMLEVEPNYRYKFISVNKSFLNTLGIKEEDVINKNVRELIPEPSLSLALKKYKAAIKTRKMVQWEETTPYKTGLKTAIVTINPLIDSKGNCTHLIGLVYDISERKNTEVLLKESEKSLLEAQKLAKIGSYNLNLKTGEAETSNTFKEIVGLDINSVVTFEIWRTITHPEDVPNNQEVIENSIKTGKSYVLEYRIITKNKKEIKWIEGNGEIVFNNGEATNIFGTIQDITLSKNNEIALKAAKDFSESLISSMQNGLSVIDISGKHILTNPALSSMTGYSEKELIGISPPFPYWPPEYYDDINEIFKKTLLGDFKNGEIVFKRKNEERFPVQLTISKVEDETGKDVAYFATVEDISLKVKAREELKAAKEFSDKLIMSMQEGLIIVNLEGKILMINDSTCKMLGYSEEELSGMNLPYPFARMEDFEEIGKTNERISDGEKLTFQFEFVKKSGEKFLASFSTGNIKNDKGEVIALFGTMKDITEEDKVKKMLEDIAVKSIQKKDVILKLSSLVGSDFHKSLRQITALAATTLNVARVGVWRFIEDKAGIICEKLYVIKTDKYEEGIQLTRNDNPNYFDALAENQTIVIEDAIHNEITKEFAKNYLIPFEISSMLDVFIQGNHGAYGVICFEHIGVPRIWTADEQEFATSIASIVSLMVESAERKVAESELKSEKEFSEKLITSLHEGLSVVDVDGKHIKVNAALCNMTGFNEDELLGIKPPFPYWPPEELDNLNKAFSAPLVKLGTTKEFIFMRKNGERFPVSLSDSVIQNKEGEIIAYFSTIIDISNRVKADKILKENIRISDQRKNIIVELANLIGEDFNSSLKKIARTSAKALDTDLVTIWEYKNDKTELLSRLFYNSNKDVFQLDGLLIKKEDNPNYFNAFQHKNSLNIADVNNNPITKVFAKQYFIPNNITSRLDVLIYGRNKHYGIISFESKIVNRTFNNEEESFVTSIASIVSLMIESTERKLAESKIASANKLLIESNNELNLLRNQLELENVYLRNELDLVFNYEDMVYGSAAFSNVLTEIEKVAPTSATVLLLGESGTGKELLARAVHNISPRNKKPLIKVNCSAIPRELIESELFGHKKGSFTGAGNDKIGKFELADGGTLFLDEIGELPLDMQPKILRFLQEGEIEVVGGTELKKLDVRVIAATNRNLKEEIKRKQFREDLYFRLNVFPIEIPSLRNRKDDIPLLVEHFVDKFNKAYTKNIKYISDDSMDQLKSYDWPGNIRELENLIERASILSTNETLLIPGFESKMQKSKLVINTKDLSLDFVQKNHIQHVLEQCNWKISGPNGAAVLLDLKPSTLRDKMAKLDIIRP